MKLSISDEVLAEIGKITVIFGLIEFSLAEIIGRIVTHGGQRHALGTIVTAEMSFKQRMSTLDSVLRLGLGEDHEAVRQFDEIKPLLFDAEQKRNTVVHSAWINDSDAADPHTMFRVKATARARRGLRTDFVKTTLSDLQQTAYTLGSAYSRLCVFESRFHSDPDEEPTEASS